MPAFSFERNRKTTDKVNMPVPFLTVKMDCMPYDQLRLLDAWEAWGIPLDQQWEWIRQLFGPACMNDMEDVLTGQTRGLAKEEASVLTA